MKRLSLVVLTLLTAGCATDPVAPVTDPAITALNRSADQIQSAWNALGQIENYRASPDQRVQADARISYPPSFSKRVTLTWNGELETLAKQLAKEAGVPFTITGKAPAAPIAVFVEVNQARIGDVLRDIGFQAGNRAGLTVSAVEGDEYVELVYVAGQN